MPHPRSHAGGMFRDQFQKVFGDTSEYSNESAKAEGGPKVRLKKFNVGKMGKGHDVFIGEDFIGKVWEIQDGGTKYQVQQRKSNKWMDKSKKFDSRMAAVDWLKENK